MSGADARPAATPPRLRRTLVVGAGTAGRALAEELAASPELGLAPLGFADDGAPTQTTTDRLPVLGTLQQLGEVAIRHRVEVIVLAIPRLAADVFARLAATAAAVGADFRYVPSYVAELGRAVGAHDLQPGSVFGRPGAEQRLEEFLKNRGVGVLDVLRGAAQGTRRLLVGPPGDTGVIYEIAVADECGTAPKVEAETRLLRELHAALPMQIRTTVPHVVGPVVVDQRAALVTTAVPGLTTTGHQRTDRPTGRDELDAVGAWLEDLWRSTSGPAGRIQLGGEAVGYLLARYAGSAQLAPALGAVYRAHLRMRDLTTPRTAGHGCLCPGHALVRDATVTGVDDWGLAAVSAEPLRDLGHYAVRHAGSRLPEVLAGRSGYAHRIRTFVGAGLAALGISPSLWRQALVLAQAENAVGQLRRGLVHDLELLVSAVPSLPRERGQQEGRLT